MIQPLDMIRANGNETKKKIAQAAGGNSMKVNR